MTTEVAIPSTGPGAGIEGLEDVETSDLVMPTIKINHKAALFVDSLSGEEFPELDCILLGLVKQRVLWDTEITDDPPMCKSYNFQEGHPDHGRFPWAASGFDERTEGTLPCTSCALKEWDSSPGKPGQSGNTPPWCSEQHTFPLLQVTAEGDLLPAIFSLQRSAIKPSRTYVSSFVNEKKPLYVVRTKLTLAAQKRGNVDFAVPRFVRGPMTDQEMWEEFRTNYYRIRDFVTTPRASEADPDDTAPPTPENSHPKAATATPPAQPVQAPVAAPGPAAASPGPAAEPTAAQEPINAEATAQPAPASAAQPAPAPAAAAAPWDEDGIEDF